MVLMRIIVSALTNGAIYRPGFAAGRTLCTLVRAPTQNVEIISSTELFKLGGEGAGVEERPCLAGKIKENQRGRVFVVTTFLLGKLMFYH
jgi:hypothetical protein